MRNSYFLAIDLGATSGRSIIGSIEDGLPSMQELTRFPNHIIEANGHCYWDIEALYGEILRALKECAARRINLNSIGIDTWGVDVGFIGKDGQLLGQPYCYRDPHTEGAPERFFEQISREKVYEWTGIQVMNFNTLYQLDTLRRTGSSALQAADKILFMPDLLAYMLTGQAVTEYTILSTSQLFNPLTKQLQPELLEALSLTDNHFAPIVYPGHVIGTLKPEICEATGIAPLPVIAVAGHDTASAVAAVPADTEKFAYLSSGTWSLMGIETPAPIIDKRSAQLNFTNEGGVDGSIRFLKNICGMWLLENLRREWAMQGNEYSYPALAGLAMQAAPFRSLINPDDPCFANPPSMCCAINKYLRHTHQPQCENEAEFVRCVFESLALRYRYVLDKLRTTSPHPIEVLHVIGGGSRNKLLNQFTASATGLPVLAGPAEATAVGNLLLQARTAGVLKTLAEMRHLIRNSTTLERFEPQDAAFWEQGYERYIKITLDT